MTTANKITILRILLVPGFVVMMLYYIDTGNELFRLLALLAFALDQLGLKPSYAIGALVPQLPAHARFGAASKAARERFEHLGRGGSASPSTVRQVCARYVDSQREKLGEKAAKDAQARFANYVLNDQRLANLEVTKLSPRMCRAGSRACARFRPAAEATGAKDVATPR